MSKACSDLHFSRLHDSHKLMSIDLAIVDAPVAHPSGAALSSAKRSASRSVNPAASLSDLDAREAVSESDPWLRTAGQGRGDGGWNSGVPAARPRATSRAALRLLLTDLVQLTKPRIVVMVLVTAVASAMIAAGGSIAVLDLLWLLIGTALVAGSAGAANQVWERRIDASMPRTAVRPLPGQRMHVATAIAFTAVTGAVGTLMLGYQFGAEAALVGLTTWCLYVLVYTPLKTRTAWNTTVGAIAGALPILIGYTALGGSLLDATGWLLVGVLVTWQYPHFMAIAWMYRRQYAEAGFRMTTTVEPTGRSAALQSVAGSISLAVCGVWLCCSSTQWLASVISSAAVIAMVFPMFRASLQFAAQRDDLRARRLLRSSLLVLPTVLLIVTLRVFW